MAEGRLDQHSIQLRQLRQYLDGDRERHLHRVPALARLRLFHAEGATGRLRGVRSCPDIGGDTEVSPPGPPPPASLSRGTAALGFDYCRRKARPDDYEEFDLALTWAEIRKYLLGARRQAYLSKANARTCWDEIAQMADWGEQEWHHRVQHTETLGLLFCNDPSSIPTRRRKNIQCQRFWEEIWPALCEAWKSHEAVAA